MMKSKTFKYSLIYLLIVSFFIIIILSFLFGFKIGVFREGPIFENVVRIYNYSNNIKLEFKKILNKKNAQVVTKNKNGLILDKNEASKQSLEIQIGELPEDLLISASLSIWENEDVDHKLIFFSKKGIEHEILMDEDKNFSLNDNIFKWPHGLIVEEENYIYYNFDGGNSITKKNLCNETIWSLEGKFHHLMSLNGSFLWALKKKNQGEYDVAEEFIKINKYTGQIVHSFNVNDIISANQPYDYFSIKQRDLSSVWEYEPFHFNDIDVLTKKYSEHFQNFSEGDLMISSRSLNSIFILNPKNLKVKKFIFGLTRRQHDPDWNKGYITIYDNQTEWKNGKRFLNSRIVKIKNLEEKNIETLKFEKEFMSDARGNHEIIEYGDKMYTLIVSPYEGKLLFFEGKKNIFTIMNKQTSDVLPISNAKILNKEKFLKNLKLCK